MNRKLINKFPIGTLVEFKRGSLLYMITYGIVIGHTSLNVKVLLADSSLGRGIITTSEKRLISIQRPYQKLKV